MKKSVLFLALAVVFLVGLGMDSEARMYGKGHDHGRGMGMAMEPGTCGDCMGMPGEGRMMGHGMRVMSKRLGLDEKQAGEFKELHLKMKKESIKKKAEIKIAELELREMLDADPVDMKTVETKVRQIESLRSELKLQHIRTHEAVKAMLTPEQKEKLDTFMGMGMKMGRGMGMTGKCGMMKNPKMMGKMRGWGQMDCCMKQMGDDAMQDLEDMDDPETPEDGDAQ